MGTLVTMVTGTWCPLAEAAPLLGISIKTARRRLKVGQLEGRQVSSRHGQAWEVWVPMTMVSVTTVDSDHGQPGQTETVAPALDLAELVTLVDRYKAEAQENAVAAAVWQERAGVLADRLAVAEGQLLALSAPSERPLEGQEPPEPSEPAPNPPSPFPWPLPPSPNAWPWLVAAVVVVLAAGALLTVLSS